MHRLLTMKRLSVLFLSLFAVLLAGMFAYENLVVAPGDRCEDGGKWWDAETRICAQPISIAEITGRPNPGDRAAASDAKNRELLAIEDSLAAQRAARDADRERQRVALAAQ
ncbi:hypothetical protein [Brevundimonas sp. UBA7664]|uniref:hypothetical protein n=1 Tax=Brevundimonas sp. UBA7664 TaxID=1946141 RepID=UPI0025C08029|nr:hypothetical protein [Brevundimonas sp. UBA7664]